MVKKNNKYFLFHELIELKVKYYFFWCCSVKWRKMTTARPAPGVDQRYFFWTFFFFSFHLRFFMLHLNFSIQIFNILQKCWNIYFTDIYHSRFILNIYFHFGIHNKFILKDFLKPRKKLISNVGKHSFQLQCMVNTQ